MRALLEFSRAACVVAAVVVVACLVRDADAGDDFGLRRGTFMPDGFFGGLIYYGFRAQGRPQPIPADRRAGTRVVHVRGPDGLAIEFMQPPG